MCLITFAYGRFMKILHEDILLTYNKIKPFLKVTESSYSEQISKKFNCNLFIKFENRQNTGSFKIRGALSKLLSLSNEEKLRGVIGMSAGNHAQGLAYAGNKLGINTNIVMPLGTPFTKIRRTKNFGGNVFLKGEDLVESKNYVNELINKFGYIEVHPYNDNDVIKGQGTIYLEMLNQISELDYLLVPVGGGGLLAGCSIINKSLSKKTKIIGVESKFYPSLYNVFYNKKLKCSGSTIAEGIAVKEIGLIPYNYIKDEIDSVISVSDTSIEQAIAMLALTEKVVVEGAGAVGLAAIMENQKKFKNKNVGIILCGGNIDSKIISSILMRDLVRSRQITTMTITMPDKPGQLNIISKICANSGANVLRVEHNRFTMDLSASLAKLDITIETQNEEHLKKIINLIEKKGLPVTIDENN